jgi:hypothetical protein
VPDSSFGAIVQRMAFAGVRPMKLIRVLASIPIITSSAAWGAAPFAVAIGPRISVTALSADRYELIYSGTRFTSRDELEGRLLLRSARLAIAHGAQRFTLLTLPGERIDAHPSRSDAKFGSKYGHWQPHWTYYSAPYGWQPWHPEWGVAFWTKDVDVTRVSQFEAHAMINLGKTGNRPDAPVFNARTVVHDLTARNSVSPH